jgi:steroid 5-alpha reductase family enzyme
MWLLTAAAIEAMALVGIAGVLATGRTRIAFVAGFNTMALVTGVFVWDGVLGARTAVVGAMVIVYLLRMNWVLFVWSGQTAVDKLDRTTPTVGKLALPVVLANTVGWAYCLPLHFAVQRPGPLGLLDVAAIGVYAVGTVFHLGSDLQKRRFKLRSDTGGLLLHSGFWSLSRHPNYFGDFLIYVSFAVLGGSVWGWAAPLANLLQYVFDAIPKNERWAAERYGAEWESYTARTKAFVPYVV